MTERHSAFCSPLPDYIHHSRGTTILFKLQNDIHRSLHSYWTFTILFTITEWPSPVSSHLKSDILQSLHDYRMSFTSLFTIKSDIHQSLHGYRMALTILFAITECHSPFSPSLQMLQPPFCSPLENDTHHYVRHYRILYRITCIHHSPRHYKMILTIMFIITKQHSPFCKPPRNDIHYSVDHYRIILSIQRAITTWHSPFPSLSQNNINHFVHHYRITFTSPFAIT